MGRPAKMMAVHEADQKKHLTKAEIEIREKGEKAVLSGVTIKERPEVRKDEIAHSFFKRTKRVLQGVGKCDAMYEEQLNRYAKLRAEEVRLSETKEETMAEIRRLQDRVDELDPKDYFAMRDGLVREMERTDATIDKKRQMMMAIEKECCFTVAAALRTVPKMPEKEAEEPMEGLLRRVK